MIKLGLAILSALILAAVFYLAGGLTLAGAHPSWADQVLVSGVVIGTILAIATTRLPGQLRVIGFSVLAIGSYLVAYSGKARFVASFAEDAFAGQMWYFGWHALCVFMVAGTISATHRQLTGR